MTTKLLFVVSLLFIIINSVHTNEEDFIKVHFICHSHVDAGWLRTFESYYQNEVVQILTHLTEAISMNENTRRFVWSEMGYLERWWNSVNEDYRTNFTRFVREGRIEIINGGWVMNDEASPTVDAVIRHLADGHRFIKEKFGPEYLPTSGWQIDPFGHSGTSAYVQSQMGYKHIVLDRVHYDIKSLMKKTKNLQFLWRGSPDTAGAKSDIFAHTLDDFYFSPEYLYFEPAGNIQFYNLERNIPDIINYAKEKKAFFKSPHILFPMGGDFFYKDAKAWMDRIDQIVATFHEKFMRRETNVKVVYGTLKQFFAETMEWHTKNNVTFNYHDRDFFPYADLKDQYWTGYFTSRPKLKGDSRDSSSRLRSSEIYHSQQNTQDLDSLIYDASKNCSILQHHDAITGTAREEVVQDYFNRLQFANREIDTVIESSITSILKEEDSILYSSVKLEVLNNFTTIQPDSSGLTTILITNALNWVRKDVFTLRLSYPESKAKGMTMDNFHCPFTLLDEHKEEIPFDCSYRKEIFIDAPQKPTESFIQMDFLVDIPAMGGRSYMIKESQGSKATLVKYSTDAPKSLVSKDLELTLNTNGLPTKMKILSTGEELKFDLKLMNYNDFGGAYLFLSKNEPQEMTSDKGIHFEYREGELVKEMNVRFFDDNVIRYRIFNSEISELNQYVHLNLMVEPKINTQNVVRISTDIKNKYFYSDNGFEYVKRNVPDANAAPHEHYYPSVQLSMISDDISYRSLVCAGDRSRGISSLKSGDLEFAIHRSTSKDDEKGLFVPAIDNQPVNVRTTCFVNTLSKALDNSRYQALRVDHPLRALRVTGVENPFIKFSGLSHQLPENIYILSIEKVKRGLIIRLSNIREIGSPTSVDVFNLFKKLPKSTIIEEYDLTNIRLYNNNDISHIPHTNLSIIDNTTRTISTEIPRYSPITSETVVTLYPLEIKSFLLSNK